MKPETTKKIIKIAVISTISLTILLIVINVLMKAKARKTEKQNCIVSGGDWNKEVDMCIAKPVIVSAPAQTTTTNPPAVVQYNPAPLCSEIKRNIEGWNAQIYPDTAKKILELTDPQLKVLYSTYNKTYAEDYPTLTKLFDNEWEDWGGTYALVVSRLKSLNLN